jgi:hypothetical protein
MLVLEKMNSSCQVMADSKMVVSFFLIGFLLSVIGCLLNLYSCFIFFRTKSLFNTPYAIFIIALSIADIMKLIAEYYIHFLFVYIQHPYFVCSITWFLTMTSENSSYAFIIALGNQTSFFPRRNFFFLQVLNVILKSGPSIVIG